MIRFRNPGTQYSTQIQVIRQLYAALGPQAVFTIEDMAIVIAQGRLMTAYGYAGDEALKLSNTDQESMNSAKMNAKMYAEVFRMLGWVTPYGDSSYPLVFTYISIHVALSKSDVSKLYEQCVLGINHPIELTDRMSYDERVRFFKCALRTFIDLGGKMYKHELCLGPMSVNDEDEEEYSNMIESILSIRGDFTRLEQAFSDLADSLGMSKTSVDNTTRLPIGFMKSCNFIETIRCRDLYNKSMGCLKITQHGIDTYNNIKEMYDLRLEEFNTYDNSIKKSLIRLGVYSMLKRSGYDLTNVELVIAEDQAKCADILEGKELLFSPYQTIKRSLIEEALGIKLGVEKDNERESLETFDSLVSDRERAGVIKRIDLDIFETASMELLNEREDLEFVQKVLDLKNKNKENKEIVDILFKYYENATQTTFYPLIATLFKIMGYDCNFSRPGDNAARWDAIINDVSRSIPIEIKSPTEEQHISIKAVRQALENKIILLSRQTHITTPETTTLVVGYYLPNDRAEVSRLISDIYKTYNYRVGVIGLDSLLSIAVSILIDGKGFDKEKIYCLEGLISASI